jgi:arsenite-transporting ATPase
MAENRGPLREIAARGTYLDAEDVERFLDLSLPGADELMAWLEIARLARAAGGEKRFDLVVVDAAPTAHTLRLLAMPEALRRFAGALDHLQERHRWMAERFGGAWTPDASDALISALEAEGKEIEELLRDPERCQVVWVMLPEILSLEETRDALAALDEAGIPVSEVIVNRVLPRDAETIAEIRTELGGRTLRLLPEAEKEPRGKVALRRVGRWLKEEGSEGAQACSLGREPQERPRNPNPKAPQGATAAHSNAKDRRRPFGARGSPEIRLPGAHAPGYMPLPLAGQIADLPWLDDIAPAPLQLLFLGGKGGVGKTTCAAAVALALARRRPTARILLISTDPAHSVADVLDVPLGDDERSVPGGPPNLRARELDAERAFAAWRERYGERAEEAVGAFAQDRGGVGELLDLTPPGIDEMIAVSSLLDAVFGADGGEPAFDLVVVDTAPTGHALRLLEMPDLALAWDHYLLSLLLKYREAVGLGDLAAGLVALSRGLKRFQELLRDPARCRFVAVTRDAELPRRETARLLRALKKLGIAVPAVILNALGAKPQAAGALRKGLGRERCAIITAPARFPPPRGIASLAAWVERWEKLTG